MTDRLLDVLEREHVPATFFVVGRAARREPALLRRMAADGDEIEDHSDTHPHLNALLAPGALDAQIADADDAIVAATGRHARWLRPPFGARNAAVLDAARAARRCASCCGARCWTRPRRTPRRRARARGCSRRWATARSCVLHDGDQGRDDAGERAYEAALAPRVIAALRARGLPLRHARRPAALGVPEPVRGRSTSPGIEVSGAVR